VSRITIRQFVGLAVATALLAVLLAPNSAAGGVYRQFPGAPVDQRTQRIREQVEELYRDGDYVRALLIYEKDLAPDGDKYAQYMVGYMTLTGRGGTEDPAAALAWYRLAAERNDKLFVQARDGLTNALDDDELRRAESMYVELWQRLGDRRLLLDLLRKDIDTLARYDVSPRGNDMTNGTLVSGYLGESSRSNIYRRVRERIKSRLDYLDSMAEMPAAAPDAATRELRELETSVREEVSDLRDY
jgi:hypothetical protein